MTFLNSDKPAFVIDPRVGLATIWAGDLGTEAEHRYLAGRVLGADHVRTGVITREEAERL